MKIAVYLPNWIGDAVMATPALRAIRKRFAQAEIVAVLRPYVADVLAGLDLVDRLFPTIRGAPRDSRLAALRKLRSERFDLAVLFPIPCGARVARLVFRRETPRRLRPQRPRSFADRAR